MNKQELKDRPDGTIQKYFVMFMSDKGYLQHEVYDYKSHLRKRLKDIPRENVRYIMKGKPLQIRIEERLTV